MSCFPRWTTLAALPALCIPLSAVPVSSTLDIEQELGTNNNKITISLDIPDYGFSSDITEITGTVGADWEIDPVTGEVSEMTFTSGVLTGTPLTLNAGSVFFGYAFSSGPIGGTILTPTPPGIVDPATGVFDATQHSFLINQGMISGEVYTFFVPVTQTVDFASTPVSGTGSGNGLVSVSEKSSTATTRTFDVVVELDLNVLQVIEVTDPVMITATVAGTGRVKATGEITVPLGTPYELWANANGIPGGPFTGDANLDKVSNGLLWAFGLQADDNPLPHLLKMTGPNTAVVTLPAGGSAAPLFLETSTTFASTDWSPLAIGNISVGANPIPAGTSGEVTVTFPAGAKRGIRLRAYEP